MASRIKLGVLRLKQEARKEAAVSGSPSFLPDFPWSLLNKARCGRWRCPAVPVMMIANRKKSSSDRVIDDEKESKHSRSFVRLFGRRRPGRGESAVCPWHALPGAHLVVIDDGRHPCPDEVKAQAEELGAEWRVSFWERGGNLRGKACIEGMLGEMLRSMDDEGDTLVKIDADTVMVSGDDLLRFADRREMVFWGSGSVEQRVYGLPVCLEGVCGRKNPGSMFAAGAGWPDAPEDIVIGTSAFNLYPGEERHMVYAPFGPDAPDSGWTAYYWGRYPEVMVTSVSPW